MTHKGHRQRMRERFFREGAENFQTHELLEMLLYYAIPQVDTNPRAHELLEHFGGIKEIFGASVDDLTQVNGIGENTATLIALLPELYRRFERDLRKPVPRYNTMSKIAFYLKPYFTAHATERLYMLIFNNKLNLLDCVLVSEGSVNCTDVLLRQMEERILKKKGASVVIAHNHPNGLPTPSEQDLELTDILHRHLSSLNIYLLEHLIFTEISFFPIMKTHFGVFKPSPVEGVLSGVFYEKFYDIDEKTFQFQPIFDKDFVSQEYQEEEE
jgi:DNA repair protein RadC